MRKKLTLTQLSILLLTLVIGGGDVRAFNNDAKTDIVWFNQTSGASSVWTMDGVTKTGDLGLPAHQDPRWKLAGTGDFNYDGQIDVVLWHPTTGQIVFWYLNGNQVIGTAPLSSIQSDVNWEIVGTGYFSGATDQKVDLLWYHKTTRQVAIWHLDGTTMTSGQVIATISDSNWQIGGTGDLNKDGHYDIVFKNYVDGYGRLAIWYLNAGTFSSSTLLPTSSPDAEWALEGTGHFNDDDNVDLVWRHRTTGDNAVWLMNGTLWVSSHVLPAVADLTWQVGATGDAKVDSDNDGLADLWERTCLGNLNHHGNDDYDGDLISTAAELTSFYDSNPFLKYSQSSVVTDGEYRLTAQSNGATMAKLSSISFQGNDVILTLTGAEVGVPYEVFFSTDLVTWSLLYSGSADGGSEAETRTYTVPNPNTPMGYFTAGDGRDFDSDGLSNGYELLVSRTVVDDPSSGGNEVPQPLASGGYFIEEVVVPFTPVPEAHEGIFLNADGNTADSLVVRDTAPNQLTVTLQTVFVEAVTGGFSAMNALPEPPQSEIALVRRSYGPGSNLQEGKISRPNVQELSKAQRSTLEYYEEVAARTVKKNIHEIQDLRSGTRVPPTGVTVDKAVQVRVNQIHTQATRLRALGKVLSRLGKIVPVIGGIMIVSDGDAYAEDMVREMDEYGNAIIMGDDETGPAAIISGYCNNLAPGSGNIVLEYLLL